MSAMKNGLFLSTCILVSAAYNSQSYAQTPSYCNPESGSCVCTENEPSAYNCEETHYDTVDELVRSKDPTVLHELLNVNTVYNADLNLYEISLDATSLNGVGLVFMHPNQGTWQRSKLLEYMFAFMGIAPQSEVEGPIPSFVVRQIGFADRLVDVGGGEVQFLSASGNVLLDIISGANGGLEVIDEASGSGLIPIREPLVEAAIAGVVDCNLMGNVATLLDTSKDGLLKADLCTYIGSGTEFQGNHPYADPDQVLPVHAGIRWGGNRSYRYRYENLSYELNCTDEDNNFRCDPEGTITKRLVVSDRALLESRLFYNRAASDGSRYHGPLTQVFDEQGIGHLQHDSQGYYSPQSQTWGGPNFACGRSRVEKSGLFVLMNNDYRPVDDNGVSEYDDDHPYNDFCTWD